MNDKQNSVELLSLPPRLPQSEEDLKRAIILLGNRKQVELKTDARRQLESVIFPSAANFLLAKLPPGTGGDLQSWLESERILIRRCDSFQGLGEAFIRLAVRSSSDNIRLVCLIERWLKVNE